VHNYVAKLLCENKKKVKQPSKNISEMIDKEREYKKMSAKIYQQNFRLTAK
jgi:hypothetical protein